MASEEQNIHIDILRIGSNRGLNGVTLNGVLEILHKDLGYERIYETPIQDVVASIMLHNFVSQSGDQYADIERLRYSGRLFLSTQASIRLNEYEELQQARATALQAQQDTTKSIRIAIGALVVSILATVTSIGFAALQLQEAEEQTELAKAQFEQASTPATLDAEQLEAILTNQKATQTELSFLREALSTHAKTLLAAESETNSDPIQPEG